MSFVVAVETGRVLGGRYRVGPRLAGGGMADVFLGHDARLDREVAIKVLRPDAAPTRLYAAGSPPRAGPRRACRTPMWWVSTTLVRMGATPT